MKRKLQAAGICGDMYEWLCDYMDGRKQYAKVNGKNRPLESLFWSSTGFAIGTSPLFYSRQRFAGFYI